MSGDMLLHSSFWTSVLMAAPPMIGVSALAVAGAKRAGFFSWRTRPLTGWARLWLTVSCPVWALGAGALLIGALQEDWSRFDLHPTTLCERYAWQTWIEGDQSARGAFHAPVEDVKLACLADGDQFAQLWIIGFGDAWRSLAIYLGIAAAFAIAPMLAWEAVRGGSRLVRWIARGDFSL